MTISGGGRHCDSTIRVLYPVFEEEIVHAFARDRVVEMVNEFYTAQKAARAPEAIEAQLKR